MAWHVARVGSPGDVDALTSARISNQHLYIICIVYIYIVNTYTYIYIISDMISDI